MIKVTLLVTLIALCSVLRPISSEINEATFLRMLVNGYSPSLVVSFLKTRVNYNKEMIGKIKNLTIDLDQSRRDLFDLSEKFHDTLIKQLISLKDADYFDTNGKDKVKYYTEQFISQNDLYPIITGAYRIVKAAMTPDDLLNQLGIKSTSELVTETKLLIQTYLNDIETKESNVNNNVAQKLISMMTKKKLQSLLDQEYNSNYQIEQNLKKLKTIVDYLYSQYNQLSTINKKIEDEQPIALMINNV